MVDPALLDPGHDDGQRLVGLSDEARALLAVADAFLQRRLEELVDAPEDRREGAAGEALVLLVEQAERDEVRRLELERPLLLGARRLTLGEAPYMRMTSSDFSLRLWAFSMLRGRIW